MSPRFALFVALSVVCSFAEEDKKSKVKKPSVLDRVKDAAQKSGITPADISRIGKGSKPSESKCKALLSWMQILPREAPDLSRSPVLFSVAINLFRDEHFTPFFGKPFAKVSEKDRASYHAEFINGCRVRFQGEELQQFETLKAIAGQPFGGGQLSAEAVLTGLAERQTLIAWAKTTTDRIPQIPATAEGFDELEALSRKGSADLQKLWPRERTAFLASFTERRTFIARTLADEALKSAATYTDKGLEGFKAIALLRARTRRYTGGSIPDRTTVRGGGPVREGMEEIVSKFDEALTAAARSAAQQEGAKLATFPTGIEGVLALNNWRASFTQTLGSFAAGPEVQAVLEQAALLRRKALIDGLPQFKPVVAVHPNPGYKDMNALRLIEALAPAGSSADPVADTQPYMIALYARLEPSAFGSGSAGPEFKPSPTKTECDTLAAHPQDAGRKAEGVADDDVEIDEAIDACEEAVAKNPSVGRYHFQLGRAYWVDSDYESALASFLKAEELKYAPAYFYLAEAYKEGLIGDGKADPAFAKQLYQMAGAAGFRPAAEAFMGAETKGGGNQPAYTFFKRPDWMLGLLVGDTTPMRKSRYEALSYLLGMQDFLNVEPHEYDPVCPKKVDPNISDPAEAEIARLAPRSGGEQLGIAFLNLLGAEPQDGAEKIEPRHYQMGVDDISLILSDYGGCSGQAFATAYATLKTVVRQ